MTGIPFDAVGAALERLVDAPHARDGDRRAAAIVGSSEAKR
jgi:hypothetical protein